jgi:hypothetical protein
MLISRQWNAAPWQAILCMDISGEFMWAPVRDGKFCGPPFPATDDPYKALQVAIDMTHDFDSAAFWLAKKHPTTIFAARAAIAKASAVNPRDESATTT